jgi:hypothetical protein
LSSLPVCTCSVAEAGKMAGGGSRGGKRKRPSGKTAFRPKGKKPAKDKEMFKRRKYARNNYVLENKVRPAQFSASECCFLIWAGSGKPIILHGNRDPKH